MRFIRPGLSIFGLILCTAAAGATDVRISADEVPAILSRTDLPDGVGAVAVSSDGSRLAYAVASAKEGFTDLVWVEAESQGVAPITLQGTIRDLAFLDDDRTLVGLHHRPAKKRQGDTFLFAWGGEPKTRRVMRVPPSSSDLDRWPGGNAILLACHNEIRTILPPDFRSGPLFSFPGDNFAVTSLGNSTYVVVGQHEGLFLLDLSVPSGRESMPVLASLGLPARVAALADYPDGDQVLVHLTDGRLFRASFDPPGFEAAGTADRIAGLAKAASGPVLPFKAVVRSADPELVPVSEAAAEPVARVADPSPEVVEQPAPVVVAEIHQTADPEPEPEETTPEVAETEPAATPVEPEPEPEVAEPQAPAHQIEGRIVGAVGLVQAVVLLGPDNILREAARVQPQSDGTWHADGLDPGRYRIQLDGGGERVLVAEPRFLIVTVGEAPTRAPEIKAVRSF